MEDLLRSGTYSHDRPLFDRLGLRYFRQQGMSDWLEVGTVELETASVKVEVYCAPAQFWRFTVTPKAEDVQAGVLTTGSGTLSEYWPSVVQWATGLLSFKASS